MSVGSQDFAEAVPHQSAGSQQRIPHSAAPPQPLGVLLIGSDFQALGVARALADADVPVFLLEPERGIARYSRSVHRRLAKHDLSSDPEAVDFLLRLAETESLEGWAVFCVDDETVEFLAKNHGALSQVFKVSVPVWNVSQNFYEKDRAAEVAQSVGIPVPAVYPSSSIEELLAADITYPVVLKPTFKKHYYEKTRDKAIFVPDRETLVREYNRMNRLIDADQIIVQEFLAGGTRNLFSFAAVFDGQKVLAGLAAHRMRQHPMVFGHATTYAESRDMPELEDLATRFLTAIGYRGVAEVEFMFDERTGTYKFLEMNGRFWGWHALTYNAGLNFPLALFQMLQGVEVAKKLPQPNARWVRMLTDGPTVARETLGRRMSPVSYLTALVRRTPDAVWSWKDPLPFLMEVGMAPFLWWKKGF